MANHYDYALLIFGLAAMGFAMWKLLSLNSGAAYGFAAVLCLLASAATVIAIVHFWRFHSKV